MIAEGSDDRGGERGGDDEGGCGFGDGEPPPVEGAATVGCVEGRFRNAEAAWLADPWSG